MSRNPFYEQLGERHRRCAPSAIEHGDRRVHCTECGVSWVLRSDEKGRPTHFALVPPTTTRRLEYA